MKTELEHLSKHHSSLDDACGDLEKAATTLEALLGECTADTSVECAVFNMQSEMVDCLVAMGRHQLAVSNLLQKHLHEYHKIPA